MHSDSKRYRPETVHTRASAGCGGLMTGCHSLLTIMLTMGVNASNYQVGWWLSGHAMVVDRSKQSDALKKALNSLLDKTRPRTKAKKIVRERKK